MRNNVHYLCTLIIFWLILFNIQHVIFLIFNYSELYEVSFREIILSFKYSLIIDISATAYLISIPFILILISSFINKNNIFIKSTIIFNVLLIISCLLIGIFDIGLFTVWGTKINAKAISYLAYPAIATQSLTSAPLTILIITLIAESAIFIYIYIKIFTKLIIKKTKVHQNITFALVIFFLLIIAFRGGFQKYPLNKGWAYYSKYPVLNYSALNGFWNFVSIIVNPDIKQNPYNYYDNEKAQSIFREMHTTNCDSIDNILTTNKPNIVLILMESVSAECSQKLSGKNNILPFFDSISSYGLLFTNFYATGFRTEQGLVAMLSSFPAQPQTTIMREYGKYDYMPNLAKKLCDIGYSNNYYYSGDLDFAGTLAYLKSSGFTNIYGNNNYNWNKKTQWGAYDEELFNCHIKEGEKDKEPFFTIIMTSTNHESFDADVPQIFKGGNTHDKYMNTVLYTDKCLKDYFTKAKDTKWYKNTLFVITSDHAHQYPEGRKLYESERHWIPLLFYGDVLKNEYKGKVCNKSGSHIDLTAMLLSQLKTDASEFHKSKNLLNKCSPEFAFYTFDDGFGIITSEQILIYDNNLKKLIYKKNQIPEEENEIILTKGKAFLQVIFEEYLSLSK